MSDTADDSGILPLQPAATVMLVRDGEPGLEVFMLRRHPKQAFAADRYVFPGGRVDEADAAFGEQHRHAMAAIRECFEESGVLLALDANGRWVTDGHPALERRTDVHAGRVSFAQFLADEGLRPALDELHWVAHWVAPTREPNRRFDTLFFLVPCPPGQTGAHDDHETVDSEWVLPAAGLERERAGTFGLMPPTFAMLTTLAGHDSVASVMEWARTVGVPPRIQPKIRFSPEGRFLGVALPTDPDFPTLPE